MAWHLGHAFLNAGYSLNAIVGRNVEQTINLARELQTDALSSFDSSTNGDLVVLAVTDASIAELVKETNFGDTPVVHTAGSVSIDTLKSASKHYGVIYPLQTLSKGVPTDLSQVPFCLEANSEELMGELKKLASGISEKVLEINSKKRMKLHLAAVMGNNFINHIFAQLIDYLEENQLPKEILNALLQETLRKAKLGHPGAMQTGPAKRGDQAVLEKHMELLADDPGLKYLYEHISRSISDYHKKS